jgi:hypothetical protein
MEYPLWGANQPLGRFDPILLQDLDCAVRRQMPALLVRRSELESGNQLTVAFQLRLGKHTGCPTIRPMRRVWGRKSLEGPVHGGRGDAIELSNSSDLDGPFGTFGRQAIQPLS